MNRLRVPLAVVGIGLAIAGPAADAQVSTQERSSVVVFPKVVADGVWDTTIQIANGTHHPVYAVCHYVNARLTFPDQPPGPGNPPLWLETDFRISLQRQQPTHWVVSRGRPVASPEPCAPASTDCDAAGFSPGRVPPVVADFVGQLVCVETDASGAPWTGNGLAGFATLTHLASGEVVKYPGVGLEGFPTNDADGRLCLGGEPGDGCPLGAEYAACPSRWTLSHPTDFDAHDVDGGASRTFLTVVPCSQNFDAQLPESVTLNFLLVNELELAFSASTTVQCWGEVELGALSEIFTRDVNGGDWLQTEVRVSSGNAGGIMLVQQTAREHSRPAGYTAVATTPHQIGTGDESNQIVLPAQVTP